MGMQSVLSVFGSELSKETVGSNWPDAYSDAIIALYDANERPGDGIYVHIESTYDRDHETFVPAVLEAVPGTTIAVLTQMNDTTDSGAAWGYRDTGDEVAYLGKIRGEEAEFGRDVVSHYESTYGIRVWTLWDVFEYDF
ncbi:hypothetical protein [Halovivax limisalsi]|uniref:hypothetical protein n=1 Tax=Halovivax limisalsi TaxID=1453760 RepID=UPI001FFC7E44|nr:hypothetical protein [Halovivax limisalsi]